MKNFPSLGIQIPEILIPKREIDPCKWSVIACDQFTSEPGYWQNVAEIVGDSPSTFHMILPEIFLGTKDEETRLFSTQANMQQYIQNDAFRSIDNLILVERFSSGRTRHGLMLALDLEKYDFSKSSQTLIRATEGTIIERLPPRIRIRENAILEIPHILVLIDDPQRTVIEPLVAARHQFPSLYDFELMLESGHLTGYEVKDPGLEQKTMAALARLGDRGLFKQKFPFAEDKKPLVFAIGDGNHSLATAKSIWEKIKNSVPEDHPARFALVELENVHDNGLEFEPIHRILYHLKTDLFTAMRAFFQGKLSIQQVSTLEELTQTIQTQAEKIHSIGLVDSDHYTVIQLDQPVHNLPVGSLQPFLDSFLRKGGAEKIDYVHGTDVIEKIGKIPGNAGFFLPSMDKIDLFKTVVLDGALPRKTFSMGEARDKRFYMECRKIA